MTTTANANGTEPIAPTAILAKVILVRHQRKQPEPLSFWTRADVRQVEVKLSSLADLRTWVKTAGGKLSDIRQWEDAAGKQVHHYIVIANWLESGWGLDLCCAIPVQETVSPLDDETITALKAVAANA